ncbi:hypothetical protein [Tolypothrix sp. VBCCA 56010]|uniref:hypothetical protein n=1 Tax=Tolypothrix sp. VBCCA 56010 TaxID=3137731 RepID=UPI003D7C53A9
MESLLGRALLLLGILCIIILPVGYLPQSKVPNLITTLIGTLLGFFLAQVGLFIYETYKQKEEFISMLISMRNELLMNSNTIAYIGKIVQDRSSGSLVVNQYGFSGVDHISARAVENIVLSPLT